MKRLAIVVLLFAVPALACCEETREWTDRAGRKFRAEIVANDAFRVTLALPSRGRIVMPLVQLSEADAAYVGKWRSMHPGAPLIDPAHIAPWPAQTTASDFEVRLQSEDARAPEFTYEGGRFVVRSDVKLPIGVVRDLNAVLEATRVALMALPLGLHSGREGKRYSVSLFSSAEKYYQAGAPGASGGFYDGASDRMLILLPNLGIDVDRKTFDHRKNLFVVKHEVTHMLLRHWADVLPMWFSEGLAEVIAAVPYAQGQYAFAAMDTAIGSYVQKWRSPGDLKPMYITPPAALLTMKPGVWQERVAAQNAYELYNSAALFTYFLLRHDGAGDGRPVAEFLDALRSGVPREKATADHIRRGRSDEKLTADFAAFLRRRGLKFEFD